MARMGKLYRQNYGDNPIRNTERIPIDSAEEVILKARKLKRIRVGNISRVVGASEDEIQDIKDGLDYNILHGKREKESKKELRRLGFLFG